ncbi:MAG: hypothetical protein ACQERN_07515 [Thermodesulfobacteriota bacterium]
MDVKSYCDTMNNQLMAWKASIYDAIRAVEKLNAADKQSVQPHIDSLNKIVSEVNANLQQLRDQCPADWSPQKQDIDTKLNEMRSNFESLSEKLDSMLADTTAWV